MKRTILFTLCILGIWVAASAAPIPWLADCGTTVTIKAELKQGYEFKQWSDGNTENPRTIIVNAENAEEPITAAFQISSEIATGMDEVGVQAPRARKVIIDDKLYIIYGDKLYDAQGALVR